MGLEASNLGGINVRKTNFIEIGADVKIVTALSLTMIKDVRGGRITIGGGSTFWNATIKNYDDGAEVEIGQDCMFSWDTEVCNTDEHAILVDGKVCNCGQKLKIGNHVWIGFRAAVMKNSCIADDCIVGRSALVAGRFPESGCVLAGVPAKVVRKNVTWSRKSPNEMVAQQCV